jgi:hypothetical protein
MTSSLLLALFLLQAPAGTQLPYPTPSLVPVSWELRFDYNPPRRIVVDLPAQGPQAFWYMTYTVTNETDSEQVFLPNFEMLTNDGRVIRSDRSVPKAVFDAIMAREKIRFLEPHHQIGGELRLGEDEARDGVAIWREPNPRMGSFSIFVAGLSGETENLRDENGVLRRDPGGQPIMLRKSLQLNYFIRGDEVHPGEDEVNESPSAWVMR